MTKMLWVPINRLVALLPERIKLVVLSRLYKLFGHNRRSSTVIFSRENGLFVAQCREANVKFYFSEAVRCPRYLYHRGIDWRTKRILAKYSSNDIQVEDGDVVFDIGANVGEFAVGAAQRAANVICFEPDAKCFQALQKNAKQLSNVQIFPYAVCAASGTIELFQSSATADSSIIEPKSYNSIVQVRSITLDEVFKELNIQQIDFLKIEAEGAEPEVLEGARYLLSCGKIRKIAIDAGPERKGQTTTQMVNNALDRYQYETFNIGDIVFARAPRGSEQSNF